MELYLQIQTLIMSFLYGVFVSLLFNLLYKYLFFKYQLINALTNMMFSLSIFGLYFYLLYKLNGGVIHLYFLLSLYIGFIIYNKIFVKLRVK